MYEDQSVEKYYDPSPLDTYGTRHELLVAVLTVLAVIAIAVLLLARFTG